MKKTKKEWLVPAIRPHRLSVERLILAGSDEKKQEEGTTQEIEYENETNEEDWGKIKE